MKIFFLLVTIKLATSMGIFCRMGNTLTFDNCFTGPQCQADCHSVIKNHITTNKAFIRVALRAPSRRPSTLETAPSIQEILESKTPTDASFIPVRPNGNPSVKVEPGAFAIDLDSYPKDYVFKNVHFIVDNETLYTERCIERKTDPNEKLFKYLDYLTIPQPLQISGALRIWAWRFIVYCKQDPKSTINEVLVEEFVKNVTTNFLGKMYSENPVLKELERLHSTESEFCDCDLFDGTEYANGKKNTVYENCWKINQKLFPRVKDIEVPKPPTPTPDPKDVVENAFKELSKKFISFFNQKYTAIPRINERHLLGRIFGRTRA